MLDEAKLLPPAGVGIVDLTLIPRGLNAKEAERFVRENGAKICGDEQPSGHAATESVVRVEAGGERIHINLTTEL